MFCLHCCARFAYNYRIESYYKMETLSDHLFPYFFFLLKGTQSMTVALNTGLLLLRLVAGLTLAAHGAQKLLGWFGGTGISGTLQMQGRIGVKPAPLWAWMG